MMTRSGYGVMEASSGYSGNDDHTHGAMKGEKMEGEKMKGKKEKNIWEIKRELWVKEKENEKEKKNGVPVEEIE